MIKITLIALPLVLSACTSGNWEKYSQKNGCGYAGQFKQDRTFINQVMPTTNGYSSSILVPVERLQYLYTCNGFSIWSFSVPEAR